MTFHSSHMTDEQIEMMVANVEASSYLSRRDGCRVTLVKCSECARMFEDELEAAKAKIVSRVSLLCLGCDTDADEPGFKGLTIQFGWFMG